MSTIRVNTFQDAEGNGSISHSLLKTITGNTLKLFGKRAVTLGFIGDSRLANSYVAPVPGAGAKSKGFQNQMTGTWLRALSMQRVEIVPSFSLAVSGNTTTQILAQARAMVLLPVLPDICLINGGTNDFGGSPNAAGALLAFENITTAAMLIRDAGIIPVVEIDTPRATSSWSAASGVASANYNRKLRLWCLENGILLSDVESYYIVPSTGEPVAQYNMADGIHSNCTGSYIRAMSFLSCIERFLGNHSSSFSTIRDVYDATSNPNGNMMLNGRFGGTSGTHTGTGSSGQVADNWMSRVISGTMTVATSKLPPANRTSLSDIQQSVISFTTAGEYRLQQNGGAAGGGLPVGIVSGDELYAECDVEIVACSGNLQQVTLNLFDYDGANNISSVFDMKSNVWPGNPLPTLPIVAANGVGNIATSIPLKLRTPNMVYADGAVPTQLHWRLTVTGDAGSSITIRVSNAQLRKV